MDVKKGMVVAGLGAVIFVLLNDTAHAQFSNSRFQPAGSPSVNSSSSGTNGTSSGFQTNPASKRGQSSFSARTQNQSPFAGPNTDKIKWMNGKNLEQAFKLAAQQNKPVMLHFWNEKCQPCLALEQFVFPNPLLAQAINSQFIPVKVNTLETPEVHRKYNVTRWPWDVFISPNGLELSRRQSPNNAAQYVQYIHSVAKMQQSFTNLTTHHSKPNASAGNALAVNNAAMPKSNQQFVSNSSFSTQDTRGQLGSADGKNPVRYNGQSNTVNFQGSPGPAQVTNKFFKGGQAAPNPAAANEAKVTVGLEGYCPVTMLREVKKVLGSKEFGCVHRGKLYFFANQSYRDIFLKDPDRYAPVLAGYDVVIYRETGRLVEGKTEFGGFVGQNDNRVVFLFASKENKLKFISDKQGRYVETARIATKNTKENWLR